MLKNTIGHLLAILDNTLNARRMVTTVAQAVLAFKVSCCNVPASITDVEDIMCSVFGGADMDRSYDSEASSGDEGNSNDEANSDDDPMDVDSNV